MLAYIIFQDALVLDVCLQYEIARTRLSDRARIVRREGLEVFWDSDGLAFEANHPFAWELAQAGRVWAPVRYHIESIAVVTNPFTMP